MKYKEHVEWFLLMISCTLIIGFMSAIIISSGAWIPGLIMYLMLIPIYFGTCPKGGFINE